jgi:hypothetical protein
LRQRQLDRQNASAWGRSFVFIEFFDSGGAPNPRRERFAAASENNGTALLVSEQHRIHDYELQHTVTILQQANAAQEAGGYRVEAKSAASGVDA